MERSVGAVAQGNGKVNGDVALRRSPNQEGCRAGAPACPSVDSASEALALQGCHFLLAIAVSRGRALFRTCEFSAVLTKAKECPQRCLPQRGIAPLLPRVGQLCGKQPTRKQRRSMRWVHFRSCAKSIGDQFTSFCDVRGSRSTMHRISRRHFLRS